MQIAGTEASSADVRKVLTAVDSAAVEVLRLVARGSSHHSNWNFLVLSRVASSLAFCTAVVVS